MPEQPQVRYYYWTRTSFVVVAVLMALTLTKFLTFGSHIYWPVLLLLPLPFFFLLNLWLAFRRTHNALQEDLDIAEQAGDHAIETLFGLSLTSACGLLIALIVGFTIGKMLGH